jgi:hypothetical protein
MDAYLRIPVTTEQKQVIMDATGNEPEGMSAWARSVLLEAARKKISKERDGPQSRRRDLP